MASFTLRPAFRKAALALLTAGALAIAAWCFAFPRAATASELPLVPVVTFGAPREWQVRPHMIDIGDSACSPQFTGLHWISYGPGGGRAIGKGRFPHLRPLPDSCDRAFYRARPKRVRIVVSRPRYCYGELMFTRIAWRARGEHAHDVTGCD